MDSVVTFNDVLNTYKSKYHGKLALEKYRFWFPLKPSEILASIIADLMCDGHIQGHPKLRLDYTSKDKNNLKRFGQNIDYLFEVDGKIRDCRTNKFGKTFNYGVNCKPLARTLILCGVPYGSKVTQSFGVPKWILENKIFFKEFVKRVFEGEGSFYLKDNWIGLEFWKDEKIKDSGSQFINEIRNGIIKHFGVKCSRIYSVNSSYIRRCGSKIIPLKFTIHGKNQVKIFLNESNINIKSKG